MELRLIPVVAFAAASLLAVKIVTLAELGRALPEAAVLSPNGFAQNGLAQNELASLNDGDITGSTPAAKKNDRPHGAPKGVTTTPPPETPNIGGAKFVAGGGSQAERALYEKLGERREALDKRQRDLELRENMLKEAEVRLQMRIDELKDIENRISGKGGEQRAKLKDIVTMYEAMNPKQAAQIFDKLDQNVLVDVAVAMKPSKLSAVLAVMVPDNAQRLTVELAKRSEGAEQGLPASDLKKIETKPAS
jgi:flagellar motility protein MotE (MotC chaperone)